jgi:hypothetical protein
MTGAASPALVGSAHGQIVDLPAELVRDPDLDASEQTRIREFVAQHVAALGSASDPEKLRQARMALQKPFDDAQASAPFRLAMAEALEPTLTQMMATQGEKENLLAVNALVLSGDLATPTALTRLSAALASDRHPIRFQAAQGLRQAFRSMARGVPAVRADQGEDAIRAIGARLAIEKDAVVAGGLTMAGLEAIGVDRHRNLGIAEMSKALVSSLKEGGPKVQNVAYVQALQSACAGVRDALGRPGAAANAEGGKQAAELAGFVLGHTRRVVQGGGLPIRANENDRLPAIREEYARAVAAASQLLRLSGTAINANTQMTLPDLAASLRAGTVPGDTKFALDAESVIGGGAAMPILAKAPFEFPPQHFVR